ncbi:MAG: metallophosphoesterase [Lachnospiraceae bacterium]|nr:metallophosphoesterase [Lachnospiraceae bacterium]
MIFLCADTHGLKDIDKVVRFFEYKCKYNELTKDDYLIILGDSGICWDDSIQDNEVRRIYRSLPVTTLFIDGNHDNHQLLAEYPVTTWHGGKVHEIDDGIIHLMRGQIYDIAGETYFTFGGAWSVDQDDRVEGISWWPEELPSEEELEDARRNLEKVDYQVDYVLTHTGPSDILEQMGYQIFDGGEKLMEFFEDLQFRLDFRDWYFGHMHEDQHIENWHCIMEDIVEIITFE